MVFFLPLETRVTTYQAVWPPSITNEAPVIKVLASLSRKIAAPLYSAGDDNLPNMFSFSQSSFNPGASSKFFSTIGVIIWPGHKAFTLTPPMIQCLSYH